MILPLGLNTLGLLWREAKPEAFAYFADASATLSRSTMPCIYSHNRNSPLLSLAFNGFSRMYFW
jgi:hypothetical protein